MTGITQCIHRNAQTRVRQISTICNGRRRTWIETRDRIARLAGALQKLDIRNGARVAILSLNSDRYYECFFAAPWAGGEVVPLNIRWSVAENARSLQDSGAAVLVFDDAFTEQAAKLGDAVASITHRIYIGDSKTPPAWAEDYESLVSDATPVEDSGRGGDDTFGIFYTGGTTGFPKGVMLSHNGIWTSSISVAMDIDIRGQDSYLHAAPMFHLADVAMSMASSIVGATQVFIPSFNADLVVNTIAQEKISHTFLVPAMIKVLLASPALQSADMESLKRIVYGASPIPEAVLEEAIERLPGCGFIQAYGQTELSPIITFLSPEHHVKGGSKLRSAGRAAACARIKIVGEDGSEVQQGTVGQIIVAGPHMMKGYLNMPEQTATAIVGGWVHTGDAGYMDEEGFIFIVDRLKDMIITGGENVFSAEVENAVASHPAVADVAVIGAPSVQWGEAVYALVVLRPGMQASESDIIAHCKTLIAGYKCPKSVHFSKEPFPLSGAGKVLKSELRKPFWEGQNRKVA